MTPSLGTSRLRTLSLLLFLFSGFSGLVYQVVWARRFATVLGTTTYAIATVLAVFMAGLALGSWLFGRVVDRPSVNGLRLYGWLEIVIGAWALALGPLLKACDWIYRTCWPLVEDSLLGQLVVRVGLVVLVLIVPTTCMGGTLPALSRFLVRSMKGSGAVIGSLYSLNTFGAVAGCLITGFFLIEALGLSGTLYLAAAVNVIVGVLALVYGRGSSSVQTLVAPEPERDADEERFTPRQVRIALLVFAVSGFASLALEVLWTRSLMFWVHIDTWAFTAMLTAFLAGIGLGSIVMVRMLPRIRRPFLVLGVLEALIAVAAALTVPLLGALSEAFEPGTDTDVFGKSLASHIVHKLGQCFFVMLVPTLLMGAAFPLVSRIYVGSSAGVGRGTGTLYALNTVGAILGSVAAGFMVVPLIGIQKGILAVAVVYGVLAAVVLAKRLAWALPAGLLGICVFVNPGDLVSRGPWAEREHIGGFQVLFYDEGPDATLAVTEKDNGVRLLTINGVTTAIDNYMDMQVHRMLSHLPMLVHPDPKEVLVVGFGMGSTVWGCLQHPVDRVDVVELLPAERRAARFFTHINHGVLDHPRLNFIVGDGRNYILATPKTYDVISFNAIHPRFSSNLYTRDFYWTCLDRIKPGGIVCAWMTQNALTGAEWGMLCRTMTDVFPHVSLWYCNPEHYCLLGSDQPLLVDWARFQAGMSRPGALEDLEDSHLSDPRALLTRFLMQDQVLRDHLGDGPVNTDDRPLIEFGREVDSDERGVVLKVLEDRESFSSVVLPGSMPEERQDAMTAYAKAAVDMMRGQTEYWYPAREFDDLLHFRRALAAAPDSEDLRVNLGVSSKTLAKLREELKERPDSVVGLQNLARVLLERGRLEDADEAIKKANRLAPRSGQGTYFQGVIQLLMDQPRAGVETLEPLIQANWPRLQAGNMAAGKEERLLLSQALYAYAAACEGIGLDRPQMRAAADKMVPCAGELFDRMCVGIRALRTAGR